MDVNQQVWTQYLNLVVPLVLHDANELCFRVAFIYDRSQTKAQAQALDVQRSQLEHAIAVLVPPS